MRAKRNFVLKVLWKRLSWGQADPASPRRENQIDVWRCEDGAGAQLAGCSTGIQIRLSKFRMLTPSLRPLITQPRLALEFGQLRS